MKLYIKELYNPISSIKVTWGKSKVKAEVDCVIISKNDNVCYYYPLKYKIEQIRTAALNLDYNSRIEYCKQQVETILKTIIPVFKQFFTAEEQSIVVNVIVMFIIYDRKIDHETIH